MVLQRKRRPLSTYWLRRGFEAEVNSETRGRRASKAELEKFALAASLAEFVYFLPVIQGRETNMETQAKLRPFRVELRKRGGGRLVGWSVASSSSGVSMSDSADFLDWFACDCQVGGEETRVIAVRGSASLADWRLNLDFEPVAFEAEFAPSRGGNPVLVHRGFYRAAKALIEDPRLREVLADAVLSGRRVAFTGHSLGGSAALLLSLLAVLRGFLPPEKLSAVFSFGSSEALCARARHLVRRLGLDRRSFVNIVNLHDVVPRMTVCTYPNFVEKLVLECGDSWAFNPYVKFCEAVGVPKPRPEPWQQHSSFLGTSRLCEPIGVVAHLVPDGRRGEGLRAELLEDLGDVHDALDEPGLSMLTDHTRHLLSFHTCASYRRALHVAQRWITLGGSALAVAEEAALAAARADPVQLLQHSDSDSEVPSPWQPGEKLEREVLEA